MITESKFEAALKDYIARPQMFGIPSSVEMLCKNVCHIWLKSDNKDWIYNDTEYFWRKVADDRGIEDYIAVDAENHRLYNYWRWGDNEEKAYRQVSVAFEYIWEYVKIRVKERDSALRERIDSVLRQPHMAGSPLDSEVVLWGLLFLFWDGDRKKLGKFISEQRKKIAYNQVWSFCDVAPVEEWELRSPKHPIVFRSWDQLISGVRERST